MALSIKNDEADHLARALAELTGESLTQAVVTALRERLERQQAARRHDDFVEALLEIGRRYRSRPLLDARTADELLYDDAGLPR